MRLGVLWTAAGLLAASITVYGQSGLTGKWQTDNAEAALEAQKNAPPAEEGATKEGGARGGRGRGGGQAIIMDLQQDASGKVTGTVTEIGNPPVLDITEGMIDGKTIKWVTMPRGVGWNLELTDDNTLTLISRTFAGRGGGAGRATQAAPGGNGGGAPGGGAPPAEGAPRGGGRGFGRGPQQPIVLHRAK